jgi:hypothetical protein
MNNLATPPTASLMVTIKDRQLYPQKLALTSLTGGGRSIGIVRSRAKAMEFSLVLV